MDRFCYQDSIKIADGVKTGMIKPMDRREVDVKISGINYNTPDSLVMEYLNKHGHVVNPKVIYDTDKEGPFVGLFNGDRRYLVDFTNGRNMGSFHLLDGAKIWVNYSGQRKTCGRCHRTSSDCPGNGIAKVCDSKNGLRVALVDHMRAHWSAIGFSPINFVLDPNIADADDLDAASYDVPLKDNDKFTPTHRKPTMETTNHIYSGVIIRNLPLDIPETDIQAFLVSKGLPAGHNNFTVNTSSKNKMLS